MMGLIGNNFLSTVMEIMSGPEALILGSSLIKFFYLLRSTFQGPVVCDSVRM